MGGNQSSNYHKCKEDKLNKVIEAKDRQRNVKQIYRNHINTQNSYRKQLHKCYNKTNSIDDTRSSIIPHDYCEKINQEYKQTTLISSKIKSNKRQANRDLISAKEAYMYGCQRAEPSSTQIANTKKLEEQNRKELADIKRIRDINAFNVYKKSGIKGLSSYSGGAKKKRKKKRK